jgi:hypothetical protein
VSALDSARVVSTGDGYRVDGGTYTIRPDADRSGPARWEVVNADGWQVGSGFASAEAAVTELGVTA